MKRIASLAAVVGGLVAFYVFIYLPVAVLVLFSFHSGRVPMPPFEGPTIEWYLEVLGDGKVTEGIANSILVGAVSSALATLLGFLAAYGMARHRPPGSTAIQAAIMMPLTMSYLVIGLGLLILFSALDFGKSLWLVGIGHVVINLPLCFAIVFSQLGGQQAALERAARDLGASEVQVITRVTVPMVWPALFAAFCLAFTFSWDEFVIAFLLTSFDVTLPVVIWSMLRTGLNPETNAAGTLVFLVSLAVALVFELVVLRRRGASS